MWMHTKNQRLREMAAEAMVERLADIFLAGWPPAGHMAPESREAYALKTAQFAGRMLAEAVRAFDERLEAA